MLTGIILFSSAIPQKSLNTHFDKNSPEYKLDEARLTLSKGNFQGAVDLYLIIYNPGSSRLSQIVSSRCSRSIYFLAFLCEWSPLNINLK